MQRSGFILACIILSIPFSVRGAVLINEIAWMGTIQDPNGSYCEWIELYNDNAQAVDISAWTLSFGNATIVFPQGTIIPAQGLFVIERYTEKACPDPVPSTEDLSVSFGSGISNTDATIRLARLDGGEEDKVMSGKDWEGIGGSNETKDTAQRTSNGWGTGTPTPGAPNVQTATQESTGTTSVSTSSSGSTKVRVGVPTKKTKIETSEGPLELTLNAPSVAYVNQPVRFELTPSGAGKTIRNSLKYAWNFGDTYTSDEKSPSHAFAYAGEYVVIVEAAFAKQKASIRHEITVLPVRFSLGRSEAGELLVHNDAPYEVDLGGYRLYGETLFDIPRNTILKVGGTLTIPASRVGTGSVTLYDTYMDPVASTEDIETALIEVPYVSATVPTESNGDVEVVHIGSPAPRREDAQPISTRSEIPRGFLAVGALAAAVLYLRRREVS